MTHALEWPSLTCQWLPTVKKNVGSPNVQEHSLLLGTHTTGEQNYLMVASCNLPKDDAVIDQRAPQDKDNSENTPTAAQNYDEDRKEVGGFGHAATSSNTGNGNNNSSGIVHNATIGKIEIRMKICHPGEVNRARYMPQNHFFVATRGPQAEVYVFDLSKHPSFPTQDGLFYPQITCLGHTKEGYAMGWSPLKEGHLLSGSEDHTVCLWDINQATKRDGTVNAQTIFKGHTDVVEDVDWHAKDPNLVASVGDDASIRLWDLREAKATAVVEKAHDGDINCVAFNPRNEFILATGSADKTVGIWDVRNLKQYVQY
jgi:histone-binding protein RBBP4